MSRADGRRSASNYSSAVPLTRPPEPEPAIAVVVLAGGSGLRVGKDRNKAYLPLGSRTAVGISLQTMAGATTPGLRRLVLVVRDDDVDLAERTLDEEFPRPPVPVELVVGGSSRHGSEERALRHLEPAIRSAELDLVLIHDAARPMCSPDLVATLVRAAAQSGGAVPGLVADDLAAVGDDGTLVPLSGRTSASRRRRSSRRARCWRPTTGPPRRGSRDRHRRVPRAVLLGDRRLRRRRGTELQDHLSARPADRRRAHPAARRAVVTRRHRPATERSSSTWRVGEARSDAR